MQGKSVLGFCLAQKNIKGKPMRGRIGTPYERDYQSCVRGLSTQSSPSLVFQEGQSCALKLNLHCAKQEHVP